VGNLESGNRHPGMVALRHYDTCRDILEFFFGLMRMMAMYLSIIRGK